MIVRLSLQERLALATVNSKCSLYLPKQLDSRLASVRTTGKVNWAAATGFIGECKMRISRIGGSRLDTDSEVWGLDQTA